MSTTRVRRKAGCRRADAPAEAAAVSSPGTDRDRLADENRRLRAALSRLRKGRHRAVRRGRREALQLMARGLVHDLNNALTPVLTASDFLLSRPEMLADGNQALSLLDSIRQAAREAQDMLQGLREFYAPDLPGEPAAVDLNAVAQDAKSVAEQRWAQRRPGSTVTLRAVLADVPRVRMNEEHLREAVRSVVFTALEAVRDGGSVALVTSAGPQGVVLRVTDSGPHLSPQERRRCLEPFFSTRTRKNAGVGLARADSLLRPYGASLRVASSRAEGTTVTMVFAAAL